MSKYDFKCQNTIFRLSLNVKIGFECKNMIFGPISNVKIVFFNFKIQHSARYFECQNRILNVKIRYWAPVRMSK